MLARTHAISVSGEEDSNMEMPYWKPVRGEFWREWHLGMTGKASANDLEGKVSHSRKRECDWGLVRKAQ